jgi:quinol monooxygenase YgiN
MVPSALESISHRAYSGARQNRRSAERVRNPDLGTLYLASVILQVRPGKRPEVLSAIQQLVRRMRALPECMGCRSHAATDDENTFVLISEWITHTAPDDLLKLDEFLVLRGMRILLERDTKIIVSEIASRTVLVLDD